MFNIITLITIIASLMNPVDLKPSYYQEYNLVGETPDILISSAANDVNTAPVIMMPEIVITPPKSAEKAVDVVFPGIIVSASKYIPTDNSKDVYMMPDIVVKAKPSLIGNIDIVQQRPGFEFDYGRSTVKEFAIYAMIAVLGVLAFAGTRIFFPRTLQKPVLVSINRVHIKKHNQIPRKKI
jgi:hypothetical protein